MLRTEWLSDDPTWLIQRKNTFWLIKVSTLSVENLVLQNNHCCRASKFLYYAFEESRRITDIHIFHDFIGWGKMSCSTKTILTGHKTNDIKSVYRLDLIYLRRSCIVVSQMLSLLLGLAHVFQFSNLTIGYFTEGSPREQSSFMTYKYVFWVFQNQFMCYRLIQIRVVE